GTKCAFLLCALDGTVRASVTGGTGNSSFESSADIAAKIRALLLQLRDLLALIRRPAASFEKAAKEV
ncbi:MAG: hypothetical protein Q4F27_04235, partial [Desulfovibrionaceae bacterium]|nr:hypothetical protein [Desulfovibrionaceae bacterium]